MDLAKAFDTVNHELLVSKLTMLGFRFGASKWMESYLSGRTQCTVVEDYLSTPKPVGCGVPQGSILGPLLFICYINDLPRQCTESKPFIYADDTAIFAYGKSPTDVRVKLQSDLNALYNWFASNKLSVNCAKSNIMLFTSSRSKYKNDVIELNMGSQQIVQTEEVKYLGLFLDPHLSFNAHVAKICSKINVRTKLMWRIRSYINLELALTLYRSLIEPHLLYCNFLIEGTSQANLNKLQVHQNNALRAVKNVKGNYSGTALRDELHVDSVSTMMKKAACKFVYKGFYNLGPELLNNMFNLYVCERELRSTEQLHTTVPKCKTQFGARNFAVRGSLYWNQLEYEVKSAPSPDSFKERLKKFTGFD